MDGSADILRKCAEKDNRVMLITLPVNGGAAAARNRGMDAARGEYLGFVDSDDWPYPDFYAKLFEAACENNADVAKGNYRYWNLDGRSLPVCYWMNDEIRKHKTSFSFAFCSAIYRRELVAAHAVTFPEDQVDIEDPVFSLKVALCCNGIAIVDDAEINIVINRDSATYSAPGIQQIYAKFSGLSKLLDVMNNDNSIVEESYAFVAAFWFKSIMTASVRNTSERAFRVIRDNLETIFTKVSHRDACAEAFKERGLADLFSALAKGNTAKLSSYLMRFYDKKIFAAAYLKAKLHKKPQGAGKACVAIPIYAERPGALERASLRRCLTVLGKHRIVFFGPESLNTAVYDAIAHEQGVKYTMERFPDVYFTSPFSYSKLLLNVDFYRRFTHSEYMLVHQLDCWVFRDALSAWCGKGYDYIGAPWFEGFAEADESSAFIEPSGNGGFSLRNVSAMSRYLHELQMKMIADEPGELEIRSGENEDRFLVRLFPEVYPDFRIAPVGEAMRFAFEVLPERLYRLTAELPFGCHGFTRYNQTFWNQYIHIS
jgi:glycosyltransferase involved in cell wall biosynthesis